MHSAIFLVQSDSNSHAFKIPPKRKHTAAPWPPIWDQGAVFFFWPACSVWYLCFVCLLFVMEVDNSFHIAFRLYLRCNQREEDIAEWQKRKTYVRRSQWISTPKYAMRGSFQGRCQSSGAYGDRENSASKGDRKENKARR